LNRATFIPAVSSFSTMGIDLDAGPKVQTIFVFGFFSMVFIEISIEQEVVICYREKERELKSKEI
jgi:hypothetical protein